MVFVYDDDDCTSLKFLVLIVKIEFILMKEKNYIQITMFRLWMMNENEIKFH